MSNAQTRNRWHPVVLLSALFLCAFTLHAAGFNDLYLGTGAGNPGVSTGDRNTALGETALASNTSGSDNTAVGSDACYSTTSGSANTGVGSFVLFSNTTGIANAALGASALNANTTGSANSALGTDSLNDNTTGGSNTAAGFDALFANTTGSNNTALGANALGNSTGSGNIAVGASAGINIGSGSNNIDIGNHAPGNESNTIRIGSSTQTAAFLAGVNGVTVSSGSEVFVDSNGQLGTVTSSIRFKEDVDDMGDASGNLMKLRPVTFHYKAGFDDGSHLLQYGLVAEEVAKVYPALVQYDAKGQPLTVRYHWINAMLLNEVQKQHANAEAQQARVGELLSQVAQQKARLEQQEARIQRLEALLAKEAPASQAP
ncbi:MAG: tail fiber domain-containing protein [Thermoanaerobaculia bacterium]